MLMSLLKKAVISERTHQEIISNSVDFRPYLPSDFSSSSCYDGSCKASGALPRLSQIITRKTAKLFFEEVHRIARENQDINLAII
jgi:hypothetical protein